MMLRKNFTPWPFSTACDEHNIIVGGESAPADRNRERLVVKP